MYFKGCVQGHNKVTIPIKNQCRYAKIKIFTASTVANHSFNVMTPPSLQPTAPFWLVVPTYNPGQAVWSEWIRALHMQTVQPQRVVVVDSGSTDGTQQLSQQAGFQGLSVAAQNFNHGGTRQWALDQALAAHTQTPPTQAPPTWVVYLTQDAILANPQSLQNLLQAFQDERVAGVYGRQLPHPHASWMETHARHFNYPATSKTVTVQDKESMGLKVCFFSDAFSAYRLSALQQQGGFPRHVPLGEDTLMAAKLLLAGHSLRYEAQAAVYHSHHYNGFQDFQRMFDTGVLHAQHAWLRETFGAAEGEGWRYAKDQVAFLKSFKSWPKLFTGLIQMVYKNSLKLLGYRLGLSHQYLPMPLRKLCAMHKAFWAQHSASPSA